MVHYEPVKVILDTLGLAEVIIDVIVQNHRVLEFIMMNWGSLFTSKFWFLLCYFLRNKKKLSTAFQLSTDGQINRQISTIEAYLTPFVNYE